MARYVGAVALGDRLAPESRHSVHEVASQANLVTLFRADRCTIWGSASPCLPVRDHGIVIGSLYRRNDSTRVQSLSLAEQHDIADSRGKALFEQFWGDYVSVVEHADGCELLRAPFGSLPTCLCQRGDALFFASDIGLLDACGCNVGDIDWSEVARHLAAGDIRRSCTCLSGILELRGGSRIAIRDGRYAIEAGWTPWLAAARARAPGSRDDDVQSLRATILTAVAAKVAGSARPLLLLSGGLDSSILACALRDAGSDFAALNFTTTEPAGDERQYARLVADAFGVVLIEAERDLDRVDITHSAAAGLTRPARRSFHQDSDAIMAQTGAALDADLIVEGGGGDNVFCSLQSVAPIADLIRHGGSWRAVCAAAGDIAELTDATIPTVLRRAVHRAWLRRDVLRSPIDTSFLTPAAIAAADNATQHPWLTAPAGAWPGSAAHIALLVAAQGWVESFDPTVHPSTTCPLLAQPIIEACLAIPSWRWFEGGQNRVIAREAFRGHLPDRIIDRRSKATPDSFVTRLYEHNRSRLAEMLLDGLLVAHGIVDRFAVERVLCENGPPRSHDHRRVMRIADAEAWIRARKRPG